MQYSEKPKRFAGKRLLILGANYETIPLVKTAQSMGVTTIVTDNRIGSPAKAVADIAWNIDGTDTDSLAIACNNEKIDGVMVGVADRLIRSYQALCDALGFPCYGTEEICRILTDKQLFGNLCEQFGIRSIPNFNISATPTEADVSELSYPVLIKPVDGCSGKGMTVCRNSEEVTAGIRNALAVSASGRFLVEKYMECDDVLIYFTFQNGKVLLSAMADRFTTKEQPGASRVCIGAVYPSKYVSIFEQNLLQPYTKLFQTLGIKNGVFLICGFVSNGEIYTYDPGFRLQGEAPEVHLRTVFGIDHRRILVEFALTGVFGDESLPDLTDVTFRTRHCATIWFLATTGKITELSGLQELENDPAVTEIIHRLSKGAIVTQEHIGTEAQVVCRVYLDCATRKELCDAITRVQQQVKAHDDFGRNMLLQGFSINSVR